MSFSSGQIQYSNKMPKTTQKSKGKDEGDKDAPLHGAINEMEACQYSQDLKKIIVELGANIRNEELDAMRRAIHTYKVAMAAMIPRMGEADPNAVLKAVKHQVGLSICPPYR